VTEPRVPAAQLPLNELQSAFEGVIPAVIATAGADGTPNVTYLSRVRMVDDEHIALSNQFFSKTSQNLAENPRASLLLIDPTSYTEYLLTLRYARTEREGPVFEALRDDVDAVAAMTGMQDVFRLRAADVYRVAHLEVRPPRSEPESQEVAGSGRPRAAVDAGTLAELSARLTTCPDLDALVNAMMTGLVDVLGYEHCLLLLVDEEGKRLYTIASHGYPQEGVGSEIAVGEGLIGMAAARRVPMRAGNLRQMTKYSRSIRKSFEDHGGIGPGRVIPMPDLPALDSRLAVPAVARDRVFGVLVVESEQRLAFTTDDEHALTVAASLVATAIANEPQRVGPPEVSAPDAAPVRPETGDDAPATTHVRFFAVDGSTFLDGDYLIKGVAGRILWSLLGQHQQQGRTEFTNREVRLDPTLELPELRDNLESRLILLKRRLEEREAPVRIEKTGRGQFRLVVSATLRLEAAG
jgi:predicted pyridoxine 5'-phosphate oxidase superfamily flavin-nucleotide-binding protein